MLERVNGRVSEADAEREIEACKAARDLTRGALREAETSLGFAERRVADAVGAVLATAAPRLIAEAEAARVAFEGKVAVLRFLRPSLGDEQRRRVDFTSLFPTDFDVRDNPVLGVWKVAAERLGRDADAPLPE